MKKALIIILAVAVLGVLATYVVPHSKVNNGLSNKGTVQVSNDTNATATHATSGQQAAVAISPVSNNSATGAYKDGSYTGTKESNPYNDVQVMVTVGGGKITDVTFTALTYESGHSYSIVHHAAPELKSQTITAQSAHIDGVSGATYTSESYVTSLQAALDQAKR